MNLHRYAENTLWAFDVTLNAVLGGRKGQTISDRIGEKVRRNRAWAHLADRVFFGHFAATDEEDKHPLIFDSSTVLAVLAGLLLLWAWAGWVYPVAAMRTQQVLLIVLLVIFLGRYVFKWLAK